MVHVIGTRFAPALYVDQVDVPEGFVQDWFNKLFAPPLDVFAPHQPAEDRGGEQRHVPDASTHPTSNDGRERIVPSMPPPFFVPALICICR